MGSLNFLRDTNAVIYLQKGVLKEPLPAGDVVISVITEIELRGFPGLSPRSEEALAQFFSEIQIIGLTHAVKESTIQLRRRHRIKLPDAIIAATALTEGAVLLTNDNDLHGIPELVCRKLAVAGE